MQASSYFGALLVKKLPNSSRIIKIVYIYYRISYTKNVSFEQTTLFWGELHTFGAPAKTAQPFLIILGARKTRDHACSRGKEIIQFVRLSAKMETGKKFGFVLVGLRNEVASCSELS